jgi:hypothetical protein
MANLIHGTDDLLAIRVLPAPLVGREETAWCEEASDGRRDGTQTHTDTHDDRHEEELTGIKPSSSKKVQRYDHNHDQNATTSNNHDDEPHHYHR